MTIALIDYGAGNLHSVHNALKAAGAQGLAITADPDAVAKADRIVLPGVGAFGACASGLRAIPGMVEAIEQRVLREAAPFLADPILFRDLHAVEEDLVRIDGVPAHLVDQPDLRATPVEFGVEQAQPVLRPLACLHRRRSRQQHDLVRLLRR